MDNENNVLAEDSNTAEESVTLETTEDVVESTESTESVEELKARLAKAEQERENQKIRAEKAERAVKTKVEVKPEPKVETGLSSKDTIALINAKVHEDDVDDVIEYARFKKVPVAEALKSSVIRATLAEKQEHRQTAQATNTGKTRGGNSTVSGETLLEKASKTGEVPEDDKAMNALLDARYKR